jgi:hypothetical protein
MVTIDVISCTTSVEVNAKTGEVFGVVRPYVIRWRNWS